MGAAEIQALDTLIVDPPSAIDQKALLPALECGPVASLHSAIKDILIMELACNAFFRHAEAVWNKASAIAEGALALEDSATMRQKIEALDGFNMVLWGPAFCTGTFGSDVWFGPRSFKSLFWF